MRIILLVLFTVLLISSCSRNTGDIPAPSADLHLKRTVQRDTSGAEIRVGYYNDQGLIAFDTAFQRGGRIPGLIYVYTYNSKGKRTRLDYFIPILYTAGFYWRYDDIYLNDTIPTVYNRYLKGNQVAKVMHFYNASGQLIKDSTYHTPNFGTFTYLTHYTYDMSGRIASSLDLNDVRDTSIYTTYQYGPNWTDRSTTIFNYNPVFKSYSQTITEYTPSGKISSEKIYGGQPAQLSSQVSYTYDIAGHLLSKITVPTGFASQEERYFYDGTTGKLEKIQYYGGGQLGSVTTYYYE